MSGLSDLTGALGTVVMAGAIMKVTQWAFGKTLQPKKGKKGGRKTSLLPTIKGHPGNFRNVGL